MSHAYQLHASEVETWKHCLAGETTCTTCAENGKLTKALSIAYENRHKDISPLTSVPIVSQPCRNLSAHTYAPLRQGHLLHTGQYRQSQSICSIKLLHQSVNYAYTYEHFSSLHHDSSLSRWQKHTSYNTMQGSSHHTEWSRVWAGTGSICMYHKIKGTFHFCVWMLTLKFDPDTDTNQEKILEMFTENSN